MPVRKNKEPVEKWEPTMDDANRLGESLKHFEVKVINDKKQYPFEQWCAKEGIIRFLDDGSISIKSTFNWHRLNKTYDLLKWKREKDLEQMMTDYPEQAVEYEKKIDALMADIRSLFGKLKT